MFDANCQFPPNSRLIAAYLDDKQPDYWNAGVFPMFDTLRELDNAKDGVSKEVVETIFDLIGKNTVLGIGSGTTILHFIKHLAARLSAQKMSSIKCVPTSFQSKRALMEYPEYFSIADWYLVSEIDIYVDGVDAVSANFAMIKGKGGALLKKNWHLNLQNQFLSLAIGQNTWKPLMNAKFRLKFCPLLNHLFLLNCNG